MEKDHLLIQKLLKNLGNYGKTKTLATCSPSSQFVSYYNPYVQVNSLNYSPFSNL